MLDKNYYDILELSNNATDSEVRKKYLELVKIHHPDIGGNAKNFLYIKEAYDVLSNKTKRKEYDISLSSGSSKDFHPHEERGNRPYDEGNFFDEQTAAMFESLFKGERSGRSFEFNFGGFNSTTSFQNFNLVIDEQISLSIACFGGKHPLKYKIKKYDTKGQFMSELTETIMLNITNPLDGTESIQVEERGHFFGKVRGNLIIRFHIQPEAFIRREGLNIYHEIFVNFLDVISNSRKQVKNIKNQIKIISLKLGMQNDDIIVFHKEGISNKKKQGDYFFILKILIPNNLLKDDIVKIENMKISFPEDKRYKRKYEGNLL